MTLQLGLGSGVLIHRGRCHEGEPSRKGNCSMTQVGQHGGDMRFGGGWDNGGKKRRVGVLII